ncbi:MAG TPA: hypothetical protein VJP77_02305, partial [Planctomycetota bacterium]|nr:hypothetical protein [Planctomycetota bacterium]
VRPRSPRGDGASFERFEFDVPAGSNLRYRVEVFDAEAPAGAEPVLRSPPLWSGPWELDPERARELPRSVRWWVVPYDPVTRTPYPPSEPVDARR